MTRLFRIGPVVAACLLLGACAQLLDLGKYDEVGGAAGKSASGGQGGHAGTSASAGHAGRAGGSAAASGGKASGGTGGRDAMGGASGESPAGAGGHEEAAGGPSTAGAGGQDAAGGAAGVSGASGASGCSQTIEIVVQGAAIADDEVDYGYYSYEYNVDPQLGTAASDYLWLDFYTGGEYNGEDTGIFELGTGDDANYASCSRCVWLGVDLGDSGQARTYFYAKSGQLDIAADSDQLNGYPDIHVTDVLLSEVTLDDDTHVSTEVPGGRCLHLSSAAVVVAKAPDGWKCPAFAYGTDDGCDCGCGIPDPDCISAQVGACEFCDDEGSCGLSGCSNITLIDNTKCSTGSQGWTCDPYHYGDGDACDCGCGVVDYDCVGPDALYCNVCDDPNSCTASLTGSCADIDTSDSSKCL
jgi:hypothetical protein